jgi:hypothetical protein
MAIHNRRYNLTSSNNVGYEPSEQLVKKVQEFIDNVHELDQNARIGVQHTERDLIIKVDSRKFRQVSSYAVWDDFTGGQHTIGGSSLGGLHI